MNFKSLILLCITFAIVANAKIYFQDDFNDGNFDGWVESKHKGAEAGEWKVEKPEYSAEDSDESLGLKTVENNRFYQITAKLDEEFDSSDTDLVFQFSAAHVQSLDCGGGYVKLLPPGIDQEDFNGDSEYNIMFGSDVCGPSTRRIHAILNHDGENHLISDEIAYSNDIFTHVYTFIIHPDHTFQILFDGEVKREGNIVDEWDILPPKEIKDPSVSKPVDWVDEKFIDDPEDLKPEGYDDIPEFIADPEAEIPDDWDADLDGDWEAPMIDNPDFEGEWVPKRIPNPDYVGEWEHPMIPNPEYSDDVDLANYKTGFVGIEIWQVKAGTIFDNFLVTDNVAEAEEARTAILAQRDLEQTLREEETKRDASAAFGNEDGEEEFEDDWDEVMGDEEEEEDHVHDEL